MGFVSSLRALVVSGVLLGLAACGESKVVSPQVGVPADPDPQATPGGPEHGEGGLDGGFDGAPTSCHEVLPGACGACLADACCDLLAACGDSAMCVECLKGSDEACKKDDGAYQLALKVRACGDGPCGATCFADPGPGPEPESGAPYCAAPTTSPSQGACAVTGPGTMYECNPVTNAGCDTELGYTCDRNPEIGKYVCFQPPADRAVCETCGNETEGWCMPGATCVKGRCAKYCCTHSDCGAGGTCDKGTALGMQDKVGVCLVP